MKKSILILSVFSLALITLSCKGKCRECTISTVQSYQGVNQTTNTTNEYCGDDYDNAPAEGTYVNNVGGGVTQTVTTTCTDK
ncbi:MAG: hypothetical protein KDC84_14625 [Crocinitomicaceae bacterium]|nr:hypothetical protein [Crocinitomicaceae bacterium]